MDEILSVAPYMRSDNMWKSKKSSWKKYRGGKKRSRSYKSGRVVKKIIIIRK